jgi:hypothetical protein
MPLFLCQLLMKIYIFRKLIKTKLYTPHSYCKIPIQSNCKKRSSLYSYTRNPSLQVNSTPNFLAKSTKLPRHLLTSFRGGGGGVTEERDIEATNQ